MADLRAPGLSRGRRHAARHAVRDCGHNEHVAWGFTALFGDVQDLYVEKLDGKGNYQGSDSTWKPLAVDHEVIHVRGKSDVTVDVQSTEHGPLINPILSSMGSHEDRAIALKWTLYDPALNTLPLYAMNTASNWAEFSTALSAWCWPTQNVVYSDDQGHIAYHAVGRVPLRPGGLIALSHSGCAARVAGLHPLRRHARRLRSAFGLSGHGQLARNHRQVALSAHPRVDGSLPHRAHLQIAAGPRRAHAQRHAGRRRPTSTARWTRNWRIASPMPSITLTGTDDRLHKAADSCAAGMDGSPWIPPRLRS